MGNRDKNEIVAAILESTMNAKDEGGIRLTRIMYNSFLSYAMVTYYLKLLTENGSLEYYKPNKSYKITDRGLRFLDLHKKMETLLFSITT